MNADTVARYLLGALFYPTFFQADWLAFAWGAGDPGWLAAIKRGALIPPVAAVLGALWATTACLITMVFRPRRREFGLSLLSTWWDLGKAIGYFWGGAFRFLLVLAGSLWGFAKLVVVGTGLVLVDLVLAPLRLVRALTRSVTAPGLPWFATGLTLAWCLLEAGIFTYVMTPLVSDVLANLTGESLRAAWIRPPLFLFLLFLVSGSYAVLAGTLQAVRARDVPAIVRIAAVQLLAAGVEIMFLYRELVDALIPWFAQESDTFIEIGPTLTIVVATLCWAGVRGMTWFLFAGAGTPVLLAMIQGTGVHAAAPAEEPPRTTDLFPYTANVFRQVKADLGWVRGQGEALAGSLALPPLQVVAAVLNFATLLLTGRHLFDLPFHSFKELDQPFVSLVPARRPPPGHPAARPAGHRAHSRPAVREPARTVVTPPERPAAPAPAAPAASGSGGGGPEASR